MEGFMTLGSSQRTTTKNKVALKAFFNIAEKWRLDNKEQMKLLGLSNNSTFYKWRNNPETAKLDQDKIERISYILGIFKELQILLSDRVAADNWIKAPNNAPLFGGRTALDLMCQGRVADLYVVRQYLASVRGV
jgi:hypothetical protein